MVPFCIGNLLKFPVFSEFSKRNNNLVRSIEFNLGVDQLLTKVSSKQAIKSSLGKSFVG